MTSGLCEIDEFPECYPVTSNQHHTDCEGVAMESLPEVVENVSKAQRQQSHEIERHQSVLAMIQQKIVKKTATAESLREELRSHLRKICLLQEETTKKKANCAGLQQALHDAVHQSGTLKQALTQTRADGEQDKRTLKEYRDKMIAFKTSVHDLEADSKHHRELARLGQDIAGLEKRRDDLKAKLTIDQTSGELTLKLKLKEECRLLQITKEDLQQQMVQLQQKVSTEESKQANIKQDIDVLQKRNQAQLTRLKCQLKEAQLRNWQWSKEATQLETQLEVLSGRSQSQED